jgi:DHA1 family bicyclomycin/chloramphenicol resistance-like MFS transporter
MLLSAVINLVANLLFAPHAAWAMLPLAVFAFGWAMMVPVVTLLVLDLHPERRGMASSLQSFIGASANGVVAGLIAPLVMHSAVALAIVSLAMLGVGLQAWLWVHRRWPDIGRSVVNPDH